MIHPAFREYERLTWSEIQGLTYNGKNGRRLKVAHYQEVASLAKDARARWQAIKLEEFDSAFRFRLGSERRVWGVVVVPHFFIVWWDPKHQIYPLD